MRCATELLCSSNRQEALGGASASILFSNAQVVEMFTLQALENRAELRCALCHKADLCFSVLHRWLKCAHCNALENRAELRCALCHRTVVLKQQTRGSGWCKCVYDCSTAQVVGMFTLQCT